MLKETSKANNNSAMLSSSHLGSNRVDFVGIENRKVEMGGAGSEAVLSWGPGSWAGTLGSRDLLCSMWTTGNNNAL